MKRNSVRGKKVVIHISRGEICATNVIPPANGASQGNYFLPKSHNLANIRNYQLLAVVLFSD